MSTTQIRSKHLQKSLAIPSAGGAVLQGSVSHNTDRNLEKFDNVCVVIFDIDYSTRLFHIEIQ
ncbi:hypothetical protein [Pseudanabaena sp. 'Roaring Creek']|uniref:hypothetical protein n=1 Tax=Pseudanabaena sp. 'Roaring Creek' TaxID=1681830 RepID=UPI0006D7F9D8|nr:hypothetical protein [Pseudanabaena sp. 'Roaring Creek']